MKRILIALLLIVPLSLSAEQKIVQGEYQAHYSVFPSKIISPKVAASYQIKRSDNIALINISPQKIVDGKSTGQKSTVSGNARNLIGNTKELEFREVIEGGVVYYIAEFSFSNQEHFRISVDIQPLDESNPEAKPIQLKFEKKFINP